MRQKKHHTPDLVAALSRGDENTARRFVRESSVPESVRRCNPPVGYGDGLGKRRVTQKIPSSNR